MDPNEKRKTWMSLLAKADPQLLAERFAASGQAPDYEWLRAPEVGGAMVRGRMGGTGAPFNLGEMTVTRCSLRLASGQVGHAYVQGRDKTKATQAALVDALMQGEQAEAVQAAILTPLQQARDLARATRAAKAAATKVDFFTMVRGED
jgi:alpha-D-ribose 1-methylphosphonate 5-triphosphate synthase subunit PhnG